MHAPLPRGRILGLIPHQGAMCLLDQALAWDATHIVCTARSHHDPANPLRRDGMLRAACGVEYAAQAIALHGALAADGRGALRGYLVSLRELHCCEVALDALSGPLEVRAERLAGGPREVMYAFEVTSSGRTLIAGRATVSFRAH